MLTHTLCCLLCANCLLLFGCCLSAMQVQNIRRQLPNIMHRPTCVAPSHPSQATLSSHSLCFQHDRFDPTSRWDNGRDAFRPQLESGPHDSVHMIVGSNGSDMGQVVWAVRAGYTVCVAGDTWWEQATHTRQRNFHVTQAVSVGWLWDATRWCNRVRTTEEC